MKVNAYAVILIVVFTGIINIPTSKIKQNEKIFNDSCVCLDDSTVFIRQM